MKIESQDQRPELYALRNKIAGQGVPVAAANVIALEIWTLQQRLAALEAQHGTAPHMAGVERRDWKPTVNGIPAPRG